MGNVLVTMYPINEGKSDYKLMYCRMKKVHGIKYRSSYNMYFIFIYPDPSVLNFSTPRQHCWTTLLLCSPSVLTSASNIHHVNFPSQLNNLSSYCHCLVLNFKLLAGSTSRSTSLTNFYLCLGKKNLF